MFFVLIDMNHPQQSQSHQQAKHFPQPSFIPAGVPIRTLTRQGFGYGLLVFFAVINSVSVIASAHGMLVNSFSHGVPYNGMIILYYSVMLVAFSACLTFDVLALSKPDYLAGKPELIKFLPQIAGLLLLFISDFLKNSITPIDGFNPIVQIIVWTLIVFLSYKMYMMDDDSGSCCLSFKPWVYKVTPVVYIYPGQQGYPPQQYGQGQQQSPRVGQQPFNPKSAV